MFYMFRIYAYILAMPILTNNENKITNDMKNFNFLSKMCGSLVGSQSNDVGFDCRLTVGSPSGLDAKWKQNPFMRFAVVFALVFVIGVGNAWGTDYFSDNFSTATGDGDMTSRSGWASFTKCYNFYGSGVRLGTSSATGSIKTAKIDALGTSGVTVIVRFSVKRWNTDATGLNISVTGAGTANVTNIPTLANHTSTSSAVSWDEKDYYEIIVTGATKNTQIQFATSASKRLILGNVSITSASDDTYRFKLVENAKDIGAGDYLIVYNNANALNTHNGNVDANTYGTYTAISTYYTAGTKSIAYNSTTEALVYRAYSTTNGYTLRKAYSSEFLGYAAASTGDYLRWDRNFTTSNDEWTLGVNSIVSYRSSSNAIRYNTSSTKFAIYAAANQSAVQLFKKEVVPAAIVNVTGVSVAPTSKSIVPGETFTITPTISPADATDKSVSWTSSATSKATVSSAGVVTGVAAGTSTITCTTTDGGYTATCAVTVRGVTLQARDEDGNTIAVGGPSAPTRSGATITAAANSGNYVFKQWDVTNASVASTTTSPTTISNPTGAVTVTAVYYKPITVTYKANGSTFTTQTYARGGTLAFPNSNPDGATYSCTGKTFVGWVGEANKDYSDASTPPTYATAGGSVTTDATYYAVFATAGAGGSGNIQLSYTSLSLTTSYESKSTKSVSDVDFYCNDIMTGNSGSDGYQKIQFKKSSTGPGYIYNSEILSGNITSIVFGSTTRDMTVNFGNSSNPDGSTETKTCTSSSLTATPTGNYKYFKILNSADNAAYTGTITINYSSISYSNYATTCCTPLGSINGSFFWTTLFEPVRPCVEP